MSEVNVVTPPASVLDRPMTLFGLLLGFSVPMVETSEISDVADCRFDHADWFGCSSVSCRAHDELLLNPPALWLDTPIGFSLPIVQYSALLVRSSPFSS